MEPRLVVKAALRAHLLDGRLLSFKAVSTDAVPERRLRKAADDEEVKDLRIWELREVLAGALRTDPVAALDMLSDLLGLAGLGVVVAVAPAAPTAEDVAREVDEALLATADAKRWQVQAAPGGYNTPELAEGRTLLHHAERAVVEAKVALERIPSPQGSLLAAGSR